MALTITLPPDAEARIQAAAREQGIAPEELAVQTLLNHLPAALQANGNESLFTLPEPPDSENNALEAERAALIALLPPEWRELIEKSDVSFPPAEELLYER